MFGHLLSLSLRFVLLGVLVASPLSIRVAHAAETVAADTGDDPQLRIVRAARALDDVRRSLEDADAPETLRTLSEKALAAQRDAEAAARALEPRLQQIDARIAQLGTPAEGSPEARDISQPRKALALERSGVDSALKRGNLLALEAKQLGESIEKMRAQQFGEQLTRKMGSPLSPALWQQFTAQVPADYTRLQGLYRQGVSTWIRAIDKQGWKVPVGGALLALVLMLPLRLWLRALGRKYAASPRAPAGRLRRTGLAVWLLLVGTVLPGLAAGVAVESLRMIGAIPPRLQPVADVLVTATFVAAFIAALSACLLVPKRPSWRLLNIDDIAAARLRKYAWGAAGLTWLSMLLQAINHAARTSQVSTVMLGGVIALIYVALISAMLVTLARLHRRQAAQVQAQLQAHPPAHPGERPGNSRSGWLVLGRLTGHLTVLAALVAALLGYLNFAMFATQQMVWVTVVVLALSLLLKFADDFALWLLAPDSASGRTLRLSTGISAARIEQGGVLLSASLRVCLLLLGLTALMAPLGNLNAVSGWLETLANGVSLGQAVLKPAALVRGVLALALGLGVMKALQHWLVETYLPKTELDAGTRNSISTVARYLGIVLAVIWALAALGIGFEKLALLASALSVGIGFGLQAITQNFVSGLILLAERPVKIGDWVRIGDQEGDIRRISVRSTEIQAGDKSTLIVPNSELITKTIRNMTMANALGRVQIQFSVPLSTDVGLLRQTLLELFRENPAVLEEPSPTVYIDSISGGQVTINSYAHVSSPRSVYAARSELLFALLQRLAELDITLVNTTDIRLVGEASPRPTQSG
ncbi:MAG: DUF3772 domain-containing protein [Stenotrophomonas sp.]